jgi:hypothetical protein
MEKKPVDTIPPKYNQDSLIAKIKPFFRYGLELKNVAPVIAYYCEFYGI